MAGAIEGAEGGKTAAAAKAMDGKAVDEWKTLTSSRLRVGGAEETNLGGRGERSAPRRTTGAPPAGIVVASPEQRERRPHFSDSAAPRE